MASFDTHRGDASWEGADFAQTCQPIRPEKALALDLLQRRPHRARIREKRRNRVTEGAWGMDDKPQSTTSLVQNAVDDFITDSAAKDYDGLLYHYTDAAGLKGIAESAQLWATGIRHLNDPLEYRYAFQLLHNELLRLTGGSDLSSARHQRQSNA